MSVGEKRIGCWFSAKKKKKVNIEKLRQIIESHGAHLKEIDISESLASQGPFDAIIHKMTDRMIEAMNGNKTADKNMKDVENYLESHPDTVVVDPLPSIRKLLDRYETYKLIQSTRFCQSGKLHIPTFAYITSKDESHILERMKEYDVEFPFVCKKSVAHGSASHKMSIIFNKKGLKDVDPPCVAQTFINHGALLHKVYVIANKYHVVERPSLRDFSKESLKDHKTIFFNSHDISSGDSSRSKLTTPDKEDVAVPPPLDRSAIDAMTQELHTELKMTMYGVDIIGSTETGKQYVIDVNVFPGYDGVPNFLDTLVEHVMGEIKNAKPNGVSSEENNVKCLNTNKTAKVKPVNSVMNSDGGNQEPVKKSAKLGNNIQSQHNGRS